VISENNNKISVDNTLFDFIILPAHIVANNLDKKRQLFGSELIRLLGAVIQEFSDSARQAEYLRTNEVTSEIPEIVSKLI
jgi:hypothetical protein